jgi:uncharacterized protein
MGQPRRSWLDPRIVSDYIGGALGRGLFARQPIRAGEVVWRQHPDGPMLTLTFDQFDALPAMMQYHLDIYAHQIGPETIAYGNPAYELVEFMNHSCEPSVWWDGDDRLVARLDLAVGDAVTYDYATSETDEEWSMECACRAPSGCRGVICGLDSREPWFADRYRGHTLSHVDKYLDYTLVDLNGQ